MFLGNKPIETNFAMGTKKKYHREQMGVVIQAWERSWAAATACWAEYT
jgi:hypothetical protein